jgi:hypothetical protein
MARKPSDGTWECADSGTLKVCGDGLNPGIERSLLLEEIPEVCKNLAGEDEDIVCSDDDNSAQKRDPVTAVWGCEGENNEPKPCGDGLNPGIERSKLAE